MGAAIKSRIRFLATAFGWFWAKVILVLWALLGSYDLSLSEVVPPEWAESAPRLYQVATMTSGWLPWWGWLLIGAGIFSGVVFEHAYQVTKELRAELQKQNTAAEEAQSAHTVAIREQTEELRLHRQQREQETDPLGSGLIDSARR